MACIYVIYSKKLNRFYIGSCLDIYKRLDDHLSGTYANSFTAKAKDWALFLVIDNLEYKQARRIEEHIKRMKSRVYIENLKKYPDLKEKLINLYK